MNQNQSKHRRIRWAIMATSIVILSSSLGASQQLKEASIKAEPERLKLEIGQSTQLKVNVLDAAGKQMDVAVVFFSRARRSVSIDKSGNVTAHRPGQFIVVARTASKQGERRLEVKVPVEVRFPPLERIEFVEPRTRLYAGTTVRCRTRVFDSSRAERPDVKLRLSSSDTRVASLDELGNLTAHRSGTIQLTADSEGVQARVELRVLSNPVQQLELRVDRRKARTGDVLNFQAIARDASGQIVSDAPVFFSFYAEPDDSLGPPATGQIDQTGRFMAEMPGRYVIVATSGPHAARLTVQIQPRDVQQRLELVGHAPVRDVHTSDLWVWEGIDGRDYAVTGTWKANGEAYFWDVTDPKHMERIDTVQVDARTVNDVKVSEDGRICVISREGASNRRNGIVILDVADPHQVQQLASFDEGLTGGVHNVFVYKNHVYAVNNGRRYDVISIEQPSNPHRVGRFELDTPGHALHDVWIEDGIAYSSNWHDGVQLVDVGNGRYGGSPERPVRFTSYAYPSGWNHAAFPFRSRSTGRFYVIAGDEAFPTGLAVKDKPTIAAGWLHFIDFSKPESPREVARYQVPGAGTHNFWVDGDILYTAYYNAGLRVVDISGELMGDLYRQGREIASYLPTDPESVIPNAPMTWGPQPHKGNIFFSDWNSGLWAVRLAAKKQK